ncbi:MAG: DUF4367 domain-containing protein [Clostridia bacterium]|nr:DUF4367 domain-containing protein [Clostridia bacterium]
MKTEEKLKQASLLAELCRLEEINESEFDPAPEFLTKPSLELKGRSNIKRKAVIAFAAAACIALALFSAVLLTKSPEKPEESGEAAISNVDIPVKPEYIPEGYYMNSCTVWADGSLQIEYMNGENKIFFQSYPANEVDLSAFEEVISNVDINGNEGFAANNFNGLVNNNIAWADGNYSYVITNSDGVNLEELVKIAVSVEREESE